LQIGFARLLTLRRRAASARRRHFHCVRRGKDRRQGSNELCERLIVCHHAAAAAATRDLKTKQPRKLLRRGRFGPDKARAVQPATTPMQQPAHEPTALFA